MQFMSPNTFLRNFNKLFFESKKLIQRKTFNFSQISQKTKGKDAFNFLEPKEGFHLSIEKAKSSYAKKQQFLFDEESFNEMSRSSSISNKSSRVMRPLSANKFRSAEDDWLERSEPKLLNNRILKRSLFSKISSTHSLPNKKIITIDEKLKKSKYTHERRNLNRRNTKLKKTTSKEQIKNSLFANKIDQKLENKPLPEDQSSRIYKKQLLSTFDHSAEIPLAYNPDEIFTKRTTEPQKGHTKHNYFVFPISSCNACQQDFSAEETKTTIQNIAVMLERSKDRSFTMTTFDSLEKEGLRTWSIWQAEALTIVLKVMRRDKNCESISSKLEDMGEFHYLGNFELFSKVFEVINSTSNSNREYRASVYENQNLKEIHKFGKDDYLLQLDLIDLRLNKQEVFWNLVYLLISSKIDYKFMLPYEDDDYLHY
jgi:hypothetical protein